MLKKILFGIVFLILLGVLAFQFLFVNIPVASTAIENGSVIKSTDIALKRFLITEVPTVALKDRMLVVGKVATADITSGSVFMSYLIADTSGEGGGSTVLTKDTIIVPLVTSPSHIPTSLRVGDTVKIVAYFTDGEATMKPSFAISFPNLATVYSIKKDDAGVITGVDVMTDKMVGTELTVASMQGTITLIQVNPSIESTAHGATVDNLYSNYFIGNQAN